MQVFYEACLYLFQRNPLLVPPRPGDKHVLDVVPQFPMYFQVDLTGHLAALLIGDELDPTHGFIVPQNEDQLTSPPPIQRMHTSRAALDRLLDPGYDAVTLGTLRKAATAVGRELRLELV
jgi:hypothetical protein